MTRRRMISPLFTQQLDYMRSFLKFFQNQFQDPSLYQYFKQDQPFMKMYRDRSADNESLRQWIKTVPLALFPHIKCHPVLGPGRLLLANLDRAAGVSSSVERLDSSKSVLVDLLATSGQNGLDLRQYGLTPKNAAKRKGGLLQISGCMRIY
ncbi:hypothetical protein PSHT_07975 [Puccinia striiformis]|uniref:Uncharacterized protein n=1 Tax=Puccinia striiformis TaxID=27350 RepID=A0A2S4VTH9_9BASI|nr:hypothetical protein PSHT_07975 [Puccinia striiformis]